MIDLLIYLAVNVAALAVEVVAILLFFPNGTE